MGVHCPVPDDLDFLAGFVTGRCASLPSCDSTSSDPPSFATGGSTAPRLELPEHGEVATALVHPIELRMEVVHEQRFDQPNR